MNATAEAARHAHQVCVVQRLLGDGGGPPPQKKPPGPCPLGISIQHDLIHAIARGYFFDAQSAKKRRRLFPGGGAIQ